MNNLKVFASKVRQQAGKLPSFDDMAANDEYIHSEEYNVKKRVTSSAFENSSSSSDSDSKTSSGAWSLIDRRINQSSMNNSIHTNSASSSIVHLSQNSVETQSQSSTTMIGDGPSVPNVQSSMTSTLTTKQPTMLSVVADALREQEQPQVASDSEVSIESNSSRGDDSSDDEGDEDDPILLLMRQSEPKQQRSRIKKKKKRQGKTKNSHRFLKDIEDQIIDYRQAEPLQTNAKDTLETPTTAKGFAYWVKSVASSQVNKILQPEIPKKVYSSAPLAMTRIKEPTKQNDNDFSTANSTSLLGADELTELAKLKKQSNQQGLVRIVMESLFEKRHFVFIFLTLILALLLYFFALEKDYKVVPLR